MVPTPHVLANTNTHAAEAFPFDSQARPARGFKHSLLLLRHFTGTCRCLLAVALPCVCFDTASLVFTHQSDRLETDRDSY